MVFTEIVYNVVVIKEVLFLEVFRRGSCVEVLEVTAKVLGVL